MSLIDLTNFSEHPAEPGWLVFRYSSPEQAAEMVKLLDGQGINSESDLLEGPPFMVGVRKRHFSTAEDLNYRALGKYRKPFIANKFWRFALIAFFALLMLVAIIGMFNAS